MMKKIAALMGALLFIGLPLKTQTPATESTTMQFPDTLETFHFRTSFNMAFIQMPEAVVEEGATIRWPSWDLETFMGLPENFLVTGRITSQIINWHFQFGAKWMWAPTENFHTYVGLDWAYFRGGVGAGAFDNSNTSTFLYPNVSAGYDFGSFALTFRGELNFLTSKEDRAGDIVINSTENLFNGYSGALYLEQPFWGTTNFILGMRMNYLKFVYQNWLLFPTTDTFYFVPEFIVGIRL